jgi:hypothetical protein
VLSRGKPETWIIPEGIAKTLDGYDLKFDDHVLAKASRKLMDAWKKWILINPLRVVRYNLNNLSGDLDIAFAYDPRIVTRYLAGAIRGLLGDYPGEDSQVCAQGRDRARKPPRGARLRLVGPGGSGRKPRSSRSRSTCWRSRANGRI